jgi:hypothetical protein
MRDHDRRKPVWRVLLPVAASTLALGLCACGGGSPDTSGEAAECFNPHLFVVGTSYEVDYQLSGNLGGTRTRAVSVQPGAEPGDVFVVTDTTAAYNPPVPGGTTASRTRELKTIQGVDILTKQVFQSQSPFTLEMPTVYQPPLRDKRYALAPGGEFAFVRSIVQAAGVSSYGTTVRYVGQESVTVPAGTFTACKFEERFDDGSMLATWIIKGTGVLAKSGGLGLTEELQRAPGP